MAELMGRPQLAIVLRPEDSTAGQIWFRDVQGFPIPKWMADWWFGTLILFFHSVGSFIIFHKPN
jgi:hypothetical protein